MSTCQGGQIGHSCSWTALGLCGAGTEGRSDDSICKYLHGVHCLGGNHSFHTTAELDLSPNIMWCCNSQCWTYVFEAAYLERLDTAAGSLGSFPSHLHITANGSAPAFLARRP